MSSVGVFDALFSHFPLNWSYHYCQSHGPSIIRPLIPVETGSQVVDFHVFGNLYLLEIVSFRLNLFKCGGSHFVLLSLIYDANHGKWARSLTCILLLFFSSSSRLAYCLPTIQFSQQVLLWKAWFDRVSGPHNLSVARQNKLCVTMETIWNWQSRGTKHSWWK